MKSIRVVAALGAWLALALASGNSLHSADAVAGPAVITGRVQNVVSGQYLNNARISVRGTNLETFTDQTGVYVLSQVPPGSVVLEVFYTGLDAQSATVTVTPGQTVTRDFDLTSASRYGEGAIVRLDAFTVSSTRETNGAAIAINEQRFAPNIMNVVAADEFGSVAEGNVGEFLKFLPGIAVGYTGGETRSVSVNGVPAAYVPVTIGGFDLASAASSTTARQVEFEGVSINNLSRIEVLQSPTPESPGSALSGSVNMVPRSAFERAKAEFQGRAFVMMRSGDHGLGKTGGSIVNPTRKVYPGFEFSYINPVNRRFGFTLSGGHSKSYMRQDSILNYWAGAGFATNGSSLPDTTPDRPYLYELRIKDDPKITQRSSIGATIDYKLSDFDRVSVTLQYSFFDTTFGGGDMYWFANTVSSFTPTSAQGALGRGEVRGLRGAREKAGTTYMPTVVYRHDGKVWKGEAGFGLSHSNNIYDNLAKGNFGTVMQRRTGVTVSFQDLPIGRPGQVTVTEGAANVPVDVTNLGSYALNQVQANQAHTTDLQGKAYANVRRDFNWGDIPISIKGGLDFKHARRDLRGDVPTWNFVGPDGATSTTPVAGDDSAGRYGLLDDYFSRRALPFGFYAVQWVDLAKLYGLYKASPQYFALDGNATYRNAVSRSKVADERIAAGYLRGDVALLNGRLKFVGGLRAEQTNDKAEGPLTDATLNFQRNASGSIIRGSDGKALLIVPTSNALGVSQLTYIDRGERVKKEYLRLFPSVNVSYLLRDNLIARASYYWSVGRPDFNQYAGGITLPDTALAPSPSNRITVNNAGIKAWTARSTKVRLEYYFKGVGQVSVGAVLRDFKNFFGNTVTPATPGFLALYDLDPNEFGPFDVSTQYNLPGNVRMTGLEFDYKQALTFLPGWARGVQVFGNASSLHVEGESADEFAGFTPLTINCGISLARRKYDVRLNWNFRSRQRGDPITGRGIERGTYVWTPPMRFLDLQAEYNLAKHFSVFANLRNLRNSPTTVVERYGPSTPASARLYQMTSDGASLWVFGVKGSF